MNRAKIASNILALFCEKKMEELEGKAFNNYERNLSSCIVTSLIGGGCGYSIPNSNTIKKLIDMINSLNDIEWENISKDILNFFNIGKVEAKTIPNDVLNLINKISG